MGEQRKMFRFRLPWMVSSAPAPPPPPAATQRPPRAETPATTTQPQTRIEPDVNPTMPARRPFRLSSVAPAQPPPIQPVVESQSRSEPITTTSTPKILPQASPMWSPKLSAAQDPRPQVEVPSPQLSAISHPPSPRQIPSQLPSPKSGPQPSSPRPTSSKARDASRPSSPDRTQFQKSSEAQTFQQPHSPPQFQSSGEKSPSLTATDVQQTKRTSQSAESPSSTFQSEANVNPTTPVRRPFRLPGIASAQPPPPIQPTVQSQTQSERTTVTSGPTFQPQATPLWSPKTSATIVPLPQPDVSLESKPQSQNSSKPASPSKTQSQATSQHPSPSSTSAQSSATPQPPSPWRIRSQERETTRLPSSKSSPQPSSPDRYQFQKSSEAETVQQPRSPSQLDFQPSKKTSPITSSPSLTATNIQQTERTATRLPSPSMMSTRVKSPQPSASLSPVTVKPSVIVSQPQSLEDHSKKRITPSVTFKSPTKARDASSPTDNIAKPPKRDIEMVQNTSLVAQEEPKERTMAVHSETSPHKKEELKIAPQTEQEQLKNQHVVHEKEDKIPKASSLDEKQTKTMTSQQTDKKSSVRKTTKDRNPFRKELRNDISMFADKLAIAHTEKYKAEEIASVVALVGKNKGAVMKLGSDSAKGQGSFKNHGADKTEPVDGTEEIERNKSAKHRKANNENDQENQITKTFINNNVQDINNSILMNSFITERNPGVHLALYYDPTEPIESYDRKGSSKARKGKSRLPLPKSLHMSPPSEGDT